MQMTVEQLRIDELRAYERNARTHSPEQVQQLVNSIREFGFTNPVLVDEDNVLIAGHGRTAAATELGMERVPAIRLTGLSEAQKKALRIADNQLALNAGWDLELLAEEVQGLDLDGFDLELLGFDDDYLAGLLDGDIGGDDGSDGEPQEEENEIPEPKPDPVSVAGDVWLLGRHRVMCGDSTSPADVEKLMGGNTALLLHADPPYGMGKQSDGVANDNIYGDELDKFQMKWWAAFRPHLSDNASAYIWGNAPDLWRLWYQGGLGDSERLELRNEIVWDKKNIAGMASPLVTQYPVASERCLFFQFGQQFLGNVNSEDFPEQWEVVRGYLAAEAEAAGLTSSDVKQLCGVGMYSHWFTRSQFCLIPEKHYLTLAKAYPGRFAKPWEEIKREWDRVKGGPSSEIQEMRSFFDNSHEPMRDVWEFSRVIGDERHGHATPKPVEMMARVMNSSLPKGGVCVEPFGGSGATLMGAELTGRVCFTMELQPQYVDVIVTRWQNHTGEQATLEGDGRTFEQMKAERLGGDE